jgi:hypothetical protein
MRSGSNAAAIRAHKKELLMKFKVRFVSVFNLRLWNPRKQ